jgi:hypothetical protein
MLSLLAILFLMLVGFAIHDEYILSRAKKKHPMFNQLKKGDYVWRVCADELKPLRVRKVCYDFKYGSNEIEYICIDLEDTYNILRINPVYAKRFLFEDGTIKYYTIYEEAETVASLTKIKREREINRVTSVSVDEFSKKLNSHVESLKKLGEDTLKELEVKL